MNQPSSDANTRLIEAIQQVANDVTTMMCVAPNKIPTTDPVGQQIVGMMLVLGRLYWAITGQDFQPLGPKGLLKWAMHLKRSN